MLLRICRRRNRRVDNRLQDRRLVEEQSTDSTMENICNEQFLEWAHQFNIGLDQRYHPPQTLILQGAKSIDCNLPSTIQGRIWLINGTLDALPRGRIYVWKRGGEWYLDDDPARETRIYLRTGIYEMFRRVGIPMTKTTLLFAKDEVEVLAAVLLLNSMIAWKVPDDLAVVHENGASVITFDSDDLFIVQTVDSGLSSRMAEIMDRARQGESNRKK